MVEEEEEGKDVKERNSVEKTFLFLV